MRFFLRMNVDRPVEFSLHHVAPVTRVKLRLIEVRIFRVPNQRSESARITVAIPRTGPGRCVAGFWVIVPDQRLTISRLLIISFTAGDGRDQ